MNVHLMTFACRRYEASRQRLLRSARQFGITRFHNFSPKDFAATAAYREHPEIAKAHRGAGLWLWKPLFIRQVLGEMAEGEHLVYLDAGAEITGPIEPLLALAGRDPGLALFTVHGRLNRHWTKRDCFVLMGCDSAGYHEPEQSMGTLLVIRNSAFARRFVEEWLAYCLDARIIGEGPNTQGLPDLEGFVEHRHDQSILTNLRIRHGLRSYADPSQFGDAFRARAEPGVDDYPALINLHREKRPSWQGALRLLLNDRRRFWQAAKNHARRLLGPRRPGA